MSILEYSAIVDHTNHRYHENIVRIIPVQEYKFATLTSDRFDHDNKKWVNEPIPDPLFQDSDDEDKAFPDEGTGKICDYFPRDKEDILKGNVGKLLLRCLDLAEGEYDAEKQHTIEDYSEKVYDFTKKQDVQDFIINWQSYHKSPLRTPVAMREPPIPQRYIRYGGGTNNFPTFTIPQNRSIIHSLRWHKKEKYQHAKVLYGVREIVSSGLSPYTYPYYTNFYMDEEKAVNEYKKVAQKTLVDCHQSHVGDPSDSLYYSACIDLFEYKEELGYFVAVKTIIDLDD